MKAFLRGLDRTLIHLYCLAALVLGLAFVFNQESYDRAAFQAAATQANALMIIAQELHGNRT